MVQAGRTERGRYLPKGILSGASSSKFSCISLPRTVCRVLLKSGSKKGCEADGGGGGWATQRSVCNTCPNLFSCQGTCHQVHLLLPPGSFPREVFSKQGFSASALVTFWARSSSFWVLPCALQDVGQHPESLPTRCHPVVTIKNVLWWGQNLREWEGSGVTNAIV